MAKRGDRSAILLAHHIKQNKETGVYDRGSGSCGHKFRLCVGYKLLYRIGTQVPARPLN